MSKTLYRLKRITMLMHVEAFQIDGGNKDDGNKIIVYGEEPEENPLYQSFKLRQILIDGADSQDMPYVYKDQFEVCYFCVKRSSQYFLIGPMCMKSMNFMELHSYRKWYCPNSHTEKPLYQFSIARMLYTVETITEMLTGAEYEDQDILSSNDIFAKPAEENADTIKFFWDEEEALIHHTYKEEHLLSLYIREGNKEKALRAARVMDETVGRLSKKSLNQARNAAIAEIAVCTRIGIEAGIAPETAYRLSDYYIQKADICSLILEILQCRDQFIVEIIELIRESKEVSGMSACVKGCRSYIRRHYCEKIYLENMAKEYGVSASHLSRLFKKEMGITIQDYINQVKIEHAVNLLLYSEQSISEISAYLNFASQSYFGIQFKKYYDMTPKQFREKNKID